MRTAMMVERCVAESSQKIVFESHKDGQIGRQHLHLESWENYHQVTSTK